MMLSPQLCDLWENNFQVYGVRKLWKAARRAGINIGRDQTARLMKNLGMRGVLRSKRVKTTRPDPTAVRHPDRLRPWEWCNFPVFERRIVDVRSHRGMVSE